MMRSLENPLVEIAVKPLDYFGPADSALAKALAAPFSWPQSGLTPLPWFPFTVAASRSAVPAAMRIAQRTERAYWHLRKRLRFTPRFRLLVLDRADWAKHAEVAMYGIAHFTEGGHLVVGSETADAWDDISRELASRLPAPSLRTLIKAHGAHRVHRDAPDLSAVAESLVAHELARVVADQARANFALPWMKDAFANYALIAVLGETDHAGLHRLGALAEATRPLGGITRDVTALGACDAKLTPFEAVLVQLALTRAAYAAYADEQDAPLTRWFDLARRERDADHELGRLLARDVHPAIGALALTGREWREHIAHAA
ncbi:MAG TPA: hypothetical protein VMN56_02130 [Casimicrobiaceae bacterium]|nr:hypothetical protein [Casimicrobiaceae bacterium]